MIDELKYSNVAFKNIFSYDNDRHENHVVSSLLNVEFKKQTTFNSANGPHANGHIIINICCQKKYFHEISDCMKIVWSRDIYREVIFDIRQYARHLRNLNERQFSNVNDMKTIWIQYQIISNHLTTFLKVNYWSLWLLKMNKKSSISSTPSMIDELKYSHVVIKNIFSYDNDRHENHVGSSLLNVDFKKQTTFNSANSPHANGHIIINTCCQKKYFDEISDCMKIVSSRNIYIVRWYLALASACATCGILANVSCRM